MALSNKIRALAALGTMLGIALTFTDPGIAANGGGGGTIPLPQLGGSWTGLISFPAPPAVSQATSFLTQDAGGNLTGQLCTQFCAPASGRVNTDGSFEFRGENYTMKGRIVGTATCSDGTVTDWISGGVQERGSTGSFSFAKCQR